MVIFFCIFLYFSLFTFTTPFRKNNNAHHVIEKTTLPDHLIKNVSGRIVFEAEHLQVYILTDII